MCLVCRRTTKSRARAFVNVRGRRVSSRGRFRRAIRYSRLVRKASTWLDSSSRRGTLARASSSRARARLGFDVHRGGEDKNARPRGTDLPISGPGFRARSPLFVVVRSDRVCSPIELGLTPGSRPLQTRTDSVFGSFLGIIHPSGDEACFAHAGAKNRERVAAASLA